MHSKFDVSVIIPTYNSEQFVRLSVGSVLEQVDAAVQLIVVDDQGTDGTRVVLEEIRRDNPGRSIVLEYRGSGLGQATARNRGIELAQGRYIAFLDSDDKFTHAHVLADWVRFADRLSLDMAGGQYNHIDAQGNSTDARPIAATGDKPVSLLTAPNLVSATSCWQFLYRTDFLHQNGIIFSPRLKQREDRLFLVEALLKASKIGVVPYAVVQHYGRDDSSFRQVDRSQLEQYVQHIKELNAAIAAARAANRVSPDFETANTSIYFNSLLKYWNRLYVDLTASGKAQTLLSACKAEFKTLAAGATSFFDNPLASQAGLADPSLLEGVTDVLRLAVAHDDDATIQKLLTGKRLSLPELRPLATDPVAEKIVCRYISFTRDQAANSARSTPPKPLSALVSRVIIHVGAPKTGTSALQHTLERNRLRLIDNGIHYPVTGTYREFGIRRERSAGHAHLMSCLLDSNLTILDKLCAEIEELQRPIHTLVLSSENILSTRFWSAEAGLPVILERLGAPNVEIVAVLRKQDDWIRSLYIEQTSNPWNKFTDSFEKLVESCAVIGLFDYESVLKTLASPTQVSKVHVGSFEQIRKQGDIVKWFWQIAAFPEFELLPISSEQANLSLSETQAALIKIAKVNPALGRPGLTRVFQVVTSNPSTDNGADILVSGAAIEAFRAKFAPFIAYYCERFGVADNPPVPRAGPSASPSLTLPKELYDLLTAARSEGAKGRRNKDAKEEIPVDGKLVGVANSRAFSAWSLARGFIPNNLDELKNAWLILRSGLFDARYYLSVNSDVARSGMNPLLHFLRYGAYEGRKPNPYLDLTPYLEGDDDTPDATGRKLVLERDVNPLIRYLRAH